jgi:glucosamine--fructose-6-phosphate aminotransferase (isomerizing)
MCGIVGGVAERSITGVLVEGLKRLEYRGYDSAGLALINEAGQLVREREVGKVAALEEAVLASQLRGHLGIAHTRWATHGAPSVRNAHPHISSNIAVVHNGIIENYAELKAELQAIGYVFSSDTDTEVVAHLVHQAYQQAPDLLSAVQQVIPRLHGAYALGIVAIEQPDELIAVRMGSPLVIGVGIGENFIGSDQLALLPVTNRFVYLEQGDVVRLTRAGYSIYNQGVAVKRKVNTLDVTDVRAEKGQFKHFMLKEIYEQPEAVSRTLALGLTDQALNPEFLSTGSALLSKVDRVLIIACGTSFHAGLVAKYWFEELLRVQSIEFGCPIAALGSEMPRQAPEVRHAATRRIKEMIDLVARQSPEWGNSDAHENALVTVATMVGTLLLARAVDDPKLSEGFINAALKHLNTDITSI